MFLLLLSNTDFFLYHKGNLPIPAHVIPLAGRAALYGHTGGTLHNSKRKKKKKKRLVHLEIDVSAPDVLLSILFLFLVFSSHTFMKPSVLGLDHTGFSFIWVPRILILCTTYKLRILGQGSDSESLLSNMWEQWRYCQDQINSRWWRNSAKRRELCDACCHASKLNTIYGVY